MKEVNARCVRRFQCRKRHEVNCNVLMIFKYVEILFQCRKRHEVNCNVKEVGLRLTMPSFNAVNGMRSIAILSKGTSRSHAALFQCRKRHEVNCNAATTREELQSVYRFQCRKRHEVNCNDPIVATEKGVQTSFNAVNGMRSIAMQEAMENAPGWSRVSMP